MKKPALFVLVFGIFFLFLLQTAGTLVESIYILDLMNTSLDEKALGLLFFFAPVLLLFSRDKRPAQTAWVLFGLIFLARGFIPYLNTLGRMLASGIGTGAGLMLFPILLTSHPKVDSRRDPSLWISAGLALAIGFSVFLRTVNSGLDYSLMPEGGWAGWGLGAAFGLLLTLLDWKGLVRTQTRSQPVTLAVIGIFLVFALAWFSFSAPSVIARWTEADYRLIVSAVSLLSVGWVGISLAKPGWSDRISRTGLLIWNLAFSFALILTLLARRVPFPPTPDAPAVVVGPPTWLQQLPLVFMLLLFPVIFLDLRSFSDRIRKADPRPRDLVPGILLGSLGLVLLAFMHIFSNVWGYVDPVSPWFRNKFWLPYLVIAALVSLLTGLMGRASSEDQPTGSDFSWGQAAFLAAVFLGTAGSALYTSRVQDFEPRGSAIVVMTYNIQGANNAAGERAYQEQLALIRQVAPDILALQESDTSRISLNNNDYVRYYADRLGYYAYYGPSTVSGTFGTAILSRFPLQNPRTVYSFSDQDEIGTAEAEVTIAGKLFTVYNVHPDGSDTAMLVWAESLLERARGKSRVIALGDYNLRDYEEAFLLIASVYTNAWESVYPSKIGADGTDLSGEDRIDHIFLSPPLLARDPAYLLPPASATDHPVHWTGIIWEE